MPSSSDLSSSEITVEKSLRGNKRDLSSVDSRRRQSHTSAERERRKKMRLHLSELQELVPSVQNTRADKVTIVEETIKYIKTLEARVEKMQKLKRERLPHFVPQNPAGFNKTWVFPNVAVNINGEKALFTVCFPNNKQDLYKEISYALHKYNIQISWVSISTDKYKILYKLQASANGKNNSDGSSYEALEETFKKAARELYLLCPM